MSKRIHLQSLKRIETSKYEVHVNEECLLELWLKHSTSSKYCQLEYAHPVDVLDVCFWAG